MVNHQLFSVVLGSVDTGLVLLLTLPSVWRLGQALRTAKSVGQISLQHVYSDRDGTASEETEASFNDTLPKAFFYGATFLGFAASIASAVFSTVWSSTVFSQSFLLATDWTNAFAWGLLLIQSWYMSVERSSVLRYSGGIYGAISAVLLLLVLVIQNGLIMQGIQVGGTVENAEPLLKMHLGLGAVQLAATVLVIFAGASLPRRPSLFSEENQPIDDQYTTSAFSRYTYGWAQPHLNLAFKKTLDLADLPRPSYKGRAKNIRAAFNPKKRSGRLLKLIFLAHYPALLNQWGLTILQTLCGFVPTLAMYNLMVLLEMRTKGERVSFEAWIWVVALGLSLVITAILESWVIWLSISNLFISLRIELSALIFEKAMQKKDVKEVEKSEAKPDTDSAVDAAKIAGPDDGNASAKDKVEDSDKSKQSTINLMSVDANRVSNFGGLARYFPDTLFNFLISLFSLIVLLGWLPLLAGLGSFCLIAPFNWIATKRYGTAQKLLMKVRDEKTAIVTEALRGMRQIKFSATESQWQEKINGVRARELSVQWRLSVTQVFMSFNWDLGPVLLSTVSLSLYAYIHGELSPAVAFTSLRLFRSAQAAFTFLPFLITLFIEAIVSVERIQKYLNGSDKIENSTPGDTIRFENASFAWPTDGKVDNQTGRFVLHNVNVSFPPGDLSVITGDTGSGKSLMLSSILGEYDLLDGVVRVPRPPPISERYDHKARADNWIIPTSIAFVAQIPWIENATIRDNVIFGLPYDEKRYEKTLSACALESDLKILTDGDMTDIGADGINLSGGQRWRVTLARALYSRAAILILDDIFSAVDTHVGRWIFDNALTGELGAGRTRILATHHAAICLSKTKYVVQLGDCTVKYAGSVENSTETIETDPISNVDIEEDLAEENGLSKVKSATANLNSDIKPKKFVEEEHRETGKIKKQVYLQYFRVTGGLLLWGICLALFATSEGSDLARAWWIKVWSGSYQTKSTSTTMMQESSHAFQHYLVVLSHPLTMVVENNDLGYYLKVLFALSAADCLLHSFEALFVFFLAIRGSRKLFHDMLSTVLRTPLRWIDTVPLGRILNRFTADFNKIDSDLANNFQGVLYGTFQLFAILVAAFFVAPIVIVFGLVLLGLAAYCARFYLNGAREVKRLESVTKSPVFEQLGSALSGVATIRAFDKTEVYISQMYDKLDDNTISTMSLMLFNRWLGFRLSILGAAFSFAIAVLIVSITGIDAALAGFALSFSMSFANSINYALRCYTSCELDMNAAERVQEYANLPIEPQDGLDAPAAWPSEGRLTVTDLVVGYAPDLPPVLKGLSFSVEKNQRVGIIGRTGAGKSSLALALYRFLEAREGSILIDGLDISKIKLFDLRSRIAIIPQDPTIFSGTVRSNLDTFNQSSDAELKEALQRVHLIHSPQSRDEAEASATATQPTNTNTNIFEDLSSTISDGGLNLSQGQRQLLCLARAILTRSKIMIMDEATSAVDMDTDVLIQRSIREEFEGSTLLVIAHRLSTIADFDRVLVMSDGSAEEFGSPRELMQKKGAFYRMVVESGDRQGLEEMIMR